MAASEIPRGAGKLGWLSPAIVTGGLAPAVVLVIRAARRDLGANPIAEAMNQLGLLALVLLVLSLAATPLQIATGWKWPIRIRKTLGLLGFFYVCAHFLVYAVLDQSLALGAIAADITKRPFILVGFVAFVLLVPLAATSTAKALKRMGFARWKRLHRLAYVAAILGIVHFVMRVKKDLTEPAIYGALLGGLFLIRIMDVALKRRDKRGSMRG
ncbi:sulfite oxidase heme-binding subunit YedZ [Polyangium spumosum]|uniref:Protein-methionine-sulfoxide reductase heme-binding subunit MsrQ n=1 Tax=Polyangium spumosum TaxID=889282 RepID=A0A6N7PXT0_9BACT|nr:protein-methionine-sulfoxide reductase heme-binding subunit MsrQ [Polyangium spumosum]MRG95260.1 sulfoxide reductase heme-binding subunit YedZ [Polyangium spumosum]